MWSSMALACTAVQCGENERVQVFLRLGTTAQAKAVLLRVINRFTDKYPFDPAKNKRSHLHRHLQRTDRKKVIKNIP